MGQFTKGKWTYKRGGILNGVYVEDQQIAIVNYADGASKANALLISKAPEMLEMLVEIRNQIEDGRTYITKDDINQLIKSATEL
jgi:hypothetical protein